MIQIAIVEDEEIYVKQLTEYIRKYQTERGRSIKVTVFGDGEDITENYSGGFDIILMDIQMPVMDGYAAARAIRASGQTRAGTVPIIAMSANAYAEDVKKCLDSGMNAHISKPLFKDVMLRTIARFV